MLDRRSRQTLSNINICRQSLPTPVLYSTITHGRQSLSNINIVLYNTGDYSRQTLSNINIVLYNTGDYSRQTLSNIVI